jgi:hypothetical protein
VERQGNGPIKFDELVEDFTYSSRKRPAAAFVGSVVGITAATQVGPSRA